MEQNERKSARDTMEKKLEEATWKMTTTAERFTSAAASGQPYLHYHLPYKAVHTQHVTAVMKRYYNFRKSPWTRPTLIFGLGVESVAFFTVHIFGIEILDQPSRVDKGQEDY
ncbi:hypothetical protein IFM58399_03619 [Aspergillus lentulus]|uniref:Uncharacterized protein n=1 Tax=Aspergillus lentulus TaxID=293939 RepID=A0ABQ0ZUM7_ASPLE|nr:uncharacterized protein IFM58399_03619 [Aspergillus lentulus]GFF33676.1 hypothetical protein IFM58399_03619 [Aspergillus lentulus]GFF61837.1 hypothetical protein IFM62136_05163 [Aspergillus lentulus]GFF64750.1 hypothetical protein IFM60648_01372 [Aspergillus lentulus]